MVCKCSLCLHRGKVLLDTFLKYKLLYRRYLIIIIKLTSIIMQVQWLCMASEDKVDCFIYGIVRYTGETINGYIVTINAEKYCEIHCLTNCEKVGLLFNTL